MTTVIDKPYVIGNHYDKESLTVWEVWSNGEAFCCSMEVSLTRSARGLWHPISTYDRFAYDKTPRGFQVLQLATPGGMFDYKKLTIESGVEKIYQEWVCKLIIEER